MPCPNILYNKTFSKCSALTFLDVVPDDSYVIIAVWSGLFVIEAKSMACKNENTQLAIGLRNLRLLPNMKLIIINPDINPGGELKVTPP